MVTRKRSSIAQEKISQYPRVALVLQGGGALGAYQAGVYEGLHEAGVNPNWVAGISIGALNCAIIAGNKPEDRVAKLKEFWETICHPPSPAAGMMTSMMDMMNSAAGMFTQGTRDFTETWFGTMAAGQAILAGQQGFFVPRPMAPGMGNPAQISYYDTSPLIATLERLCDFDRINDSDMRVSLGATNVRNGNFVYFDNTEITLTPHHFLASGSLPPGFPATEIEGEFYWDGGCVSNTPLEYVIAGQHRKDTLVFQIDLWSAKGKLPETIGDVMTRMKDIQYSSRTRNITTAIKEMQGLRDLLNETIQKVSPAVRAKDPFFKELTAKLEGVRYNCIHLIYQNKQTEGSYKDVEFSHETKQYHWSEGLSDMRLTFDHPDCLNLPPKGQTFTQFDVHRESWAHAAKSV